MTTKNPKYTLYADDTGVIGNNHSRKDFKTNTNKLF